MKLEKLAHFQSELTFLVKKILLWHLRTWIARPVSGLILGLRPANETLCYLVTTILIGWAQA